MHKYILYNQIVTGNMHQPKAILIHPKETSSCIHYSIRSNQSSRDGRINSSLHSIKEKRNTNRKKKDTPWISFSTNVWIRRRSDQL